jgi:hypothetical protein
MLSKISSWWLASSIVLLGLAGCAEFDQRKGLDPIIDATAVQTASFNKTIIINALAEDAGYRPGEPVDYYRVAEAGFNYVDDRCRSYFDSLFFLERRRDELKSGLAASAATTAAILGVTHAAVPTLTIVAAAFGLASSATDIVAGTYLYRLPPATTQGFVERRQLAFREGAAANRGGINTPTSAYFQIQRYLSLCLPPTIEAEITRQISSTGAIPVQSGPGGFFSVESVGPPGIGPTVVRPRIALLSSSKKPLPPTKPTPRGPLPPGFLNSFEERLSADQIRAIQLTVCVDADGKLGPEGSVTRKAIVEFFEGFGTPRPDISTGGGLKVKDREILDDAFNSTTGGKGCLASGFKNPKKVGAFSHQ